MICPLNSIARALSCTTWLTFLGVASWLTSISSDYWVIIVGRNHGFELQDAEHLTFLWSYSGLWRRCDVLTHRWSTVNWRKTTLGSFKHFTFIVFRENHSDIQTKCHDHQEHDHRENLIKVSNQFCTYILQLSNPWWPFEIGWRDGLHTCWTNMCGNRCCYDSCLIIIFFVCSNSSTLCLQEIIRSFAHHDNFIGDDCHRGEVIMAYFKVNQSTKKIFA